MEYQPIEHTDHGGGHEEWLFHFSRHGLDCSVTITAWPTGNWGWKSLIDARGLGVEPPPPVTGADRVRHGGMSGPPRLLPLIEIGGLFPDLSCSETLTMALEQIDDYYFDAEKE